MMRQLNLLLIIILIIIVSYALRPQALSSAGDEDRILGAVAGADAARPVAAAAASADPGSPPPAEPASTPPSKEKKIDYDALIGDSPILGDPDAPVTMIVWTDFGCGFCREFHTGPFQEIKASYIDTGKVRFVSKDFPLDEHMFSQKAAEAVKCAALEDKHWEMYDKIFEEGITRSSDLTRFAEELGLGDAFYECFDSGVMAGEVKSEKKLGESLGFSGTPSFIISEKTIIGKKEYRSFERAIDAEYNKAMAS